MRFLVEDSGLISYAGSLDPKGRNAKRYRFTEYCLLAEHWYDVAGTCIQNPHPVGTEDRDMIVKGQAMGNFLITWRSEKGIKGELRKRAVRYVFGGGALAVVSAAWLLSKLGWL